MVRAIVGHSDIEVTMTIYAHVSLAKNAKALGKLGEASDVDHLPSRLLSNEPSTRSQRNVGWSKVVVRGGVEPPTFRFSGGRSYQLSYLTLATLR